MLASTTRMQHATQHMKYREIRGEFAAMIRRRFQTNDRAPFQKYLQETADDHLILDHDTWIKRIGRVKQDDIYGFISPQGWPEMTI